jgi:hypothetical protein
MMKKFVLFLIILWGNFSNALTAAEADEWYRVPSSAYRSNIPGLAVEVNNKHIKLIELGEEKLIPLTYLKHTDYLRDRSGIPSLGLSITKEGEFRYRFVSGKYDVHLGTLAISPEYEGPLILSAGMGSTAAGGT